MIIRLIVCSFLLALSSFALALSYADHKVADFAVRYFNSKGVSHIYDSYSGRDKKQKTIKGHVETEKGEFSYDEKSGTFYFNIDDAQKVVLDDRVADARNNYISIDVCGNKSPSSYRGYDSHLFNGDLIDEILLYATKNYTNMAEEIKINNDVYPITYKQNIGMKYLTIADYWEQECLMFYKNSTNNNMRLFGFSLIDLSYDEMVALKTDKSRVLFILVDKKDNNNEDLSADKNVPSIYKVLLSVLLDFLVR